MYKDNIYKTTQNKNRIGATDGSVCVCVVRGGVCIFNICTNTQKAHMTCFTLGEIGTVQYVQPLQ